MFSGAPNRAPLPDDLRVPPEASSFALPVGAVPFDPPISVNWGRPQAPRLFILTLLFPGAEPVIFVLLLTLTFR